jgi:hypothetical protein
MLYVEDTLGEFVSGLLSGAESEGSTATLF